MPKGKVANRLKFGGKRYTYWNYTMSKTSANKWAEGQRKKGWLVRVVSRIGTDGKTYWLIYRRKK